MDIKRKKHHLLSPFCILLILSFTLVNGADPTVWGPGNNWIVTYIHTAKITLNDTIVLNDENLPVTEMKIVDLKNNQYDYDYLGLYNGNFSTTIEMILPNNQNQFYIPAGGLPILLPLQYRDIDNWIEIFANNVKDTDPDILYNLGMSRLLTENSTIEGNELIFTANYFETAGNLERDYYYLPFITNANTSKMYDSNVISSLSYSLQSGILFRLSLQTISNDVVIEPWLFYENIEIMQEIEFVAAIPPTLQIDTFINLSTLLVIVLFVVYLVVRRKY